MRRLTNTSGSDFEGITCDVCWDRNHTTENCTRSDLIERMSRTVGSAQGTRQQRNYGGGEVRLASEKQVNFLRSLRTEQGITVGDEEKLTSKTASKLIDHLLASARERRAALAAERASQPVEPIAVAAVVDGLNLRSLPSGKYGVPGGDTRLKVQIDVVEKGKWAGWVFVKDAAEYGEGRRYGSQRPDGAYRGEIVEQLTAIAADPQAAAVRYGELTGRCAICNRQLEDEQSVARGIGPICWGNVGW